MKYVVKRRDFSALQHPHGSQERLMLNRDWLTSEYQVSYKYGVRGEDGSHTPFTYRTKAEAELKAQALSEEGTP